MQNSGSTTLHYQWRCIDDLHAMLKKHGDWMELGGADEQKPVKEGTVEACGLSQKSRGRMVWFKKRISRHFGVYVPPLMEALGKAEITHEARNNKMKAR